MANAIKLTSTVYFFLGLTALVFFGDLVAFFAGLEAVPITHLRHAFIQYCAPFPLLRWEYLYAMAAAIKNMDSAVT